MKPSFTFFAAIIAVASAMTAAKAQYRTEGSVPAFSNRPPGRIVNNMVRQPATENQVQEALAKLKKAKNEQEKQAAEAKLGEVLGKQFDADLKRRMNELVAIKQRYEKMAALLKKREESKADIIALRVQVLTNQAEGLGWQGGNTLLNAFDHPELTEPPYEMPANESRSIIRQPSR